MEKEDEKQKKEKKGNKEHLKKYMDNENIAMLQQSSDQRVSERGSDSLFLVNETNEDLGF